MSELAEFERMIALRDSYEERCEFYTDVMNEIVGDEKRSNGTIPDHIKFTPQFQDAWKMYHLSFKKLRECNKVLTRKFKKEYREYSIKERDERRANKLKNSK